MAEDLGKKLLAEVEEVGLDEVSEAHEKKAVWNSMTDKL